MANLPAAGATAGTGFAYGIGWEIILMHIAAGLFAVNSIQKLCFPHGTQRCNRQHLGLTPGKHTGTMDPGQHTDLCCQWPHLIQLSAVNPLAFIQQPAADNELLQLINTLIDLRCLIRMGFFEFLMNILHDRGPSGLPAPPYHRYPMRTLHGQWHIP